MTGMTAGFEQMSDDLQAQLDSRRTALAAARARGQAREGRDLRAALAGADRRPLRPLGAGRAAWQHRVGAPALPGAPPRRGGQPRQGRVHRGGEPRAAHAARTACWAWPRRWSSPTFRSRSPRRSKAILQSGSTLLTLVNDILDLAKIEAGRLEIAPMASNLRESLDSVVRLYAPQAAENGVRASARDRARHAGGAGLRSDARAPGRVQPRLQRGEVHPCGRVTVRAEPFAAQGPPMLPHRGRGHRDRHERRDPGQAVPAVHPG